MKFAKGKSAAITAGLCAALTISQTIAPVSQAFALSNAEVSAKTNNSDPVVVFVAQGGQFAGGVEAMRVAAQMDGTIVLPLQPTREGFTFHGWSYDPRGDKMYEQGDKIDVDKHVTLYAQWQKNDVVEFLTSFDANGGVFFDGKDYTETAPQKDGSVVFPLLPTREGYTLTGWSYDREGADPFVEGTKLDKHVTLYAQWQKNDVVEFLTSFDANGGVFFDGKDYTETAPQKDGSVVFPLLPTREGYTLTGWSYDREGADPFVEGTKLDKHVTLYAQWQKNDVVSTHTVTFHAEDGTFLQTVEYKSDQAFGLFSEGIAPEKGGYEFAGWTYGDEAHTPVKADGVVTGDWHVYASYVKKDAPQAKVFKVTFWDGLTWTEDAVVEVEEGKTVAAPTDPECEGFKFEGWFVDKALKEAYDFSAPVNGDMVLYAKWSKTAEAPKDEQKPVTPSDKNAGLPQTGDASMIAMGFAAASGAVLSAAGYFSSKRRKH